MDSSLITRARMGRLCVEAMTMSAPSNAWERFTATGAVDDYLRYLAESRGVPETREGVGDAHCCTRNRDPDEIGRGRSPADPAHR